MYSVILCSALALFLGFGGFLLGLVLFLILLFFLATVFFTGTGRDLLLPQCGKQVFEALLVVGSGRCIGFRHEDIAIGQHI